MQLTLTDRFFWIKLCAKPSSITRTETIILCGADEEKKNNNQCVSIDLNKTSSMQLPFQWLKKVLRRGSSHSRNKIR